MHALEARSALTDVGKKQIGPRARQRRVGIRRSASAGAVAGAAAAEATAVAVEGTAGSSQRSVPSSSWQNSFLTAAADPDGKI